MYIKDVVRHLNEAQVPKLGNVRPIDINSFLDDYKIRDAQKDENIIPPRAPTLTERRENEKKYENGSNVLQLNDLVYLDQKETQFTKQYTQKVRN